MIRRDIQKKVLDTPLIWTLDLNKPAPILKKGRRVNILN